MNFRGEGAFADAGDVGLCDADNGLDGGGANSGAGDGAAGGLKCPPGDLGDAVRGSQVGGDRERHGRHLGRKHRIHQLLDAHHAVHERVLGMHTQMHEAAVHGANTSAASASRTGSKERRCNGVGACSLRAARCPGVA